MRSGWVNALTPQESTEALLYTYENYPRLWGKYGFYDSYNLDQPEPWFSQEYIGINKGITLLMIENYFSGLVWDLYMKNQYVRDGLKNLMFSEITKGMGQPDCSINSSLKTA